MIAPALLFAVYAVPMALVGGAWARHHARRSARARAQLARNRSAGLAEPPSLHPLIDPVRCIGCGACIRACPESGVLDLIGRTATLVEPWACVGHGTCEAACPTQAITLVHGSASHPVAIPRLGPGGATSVPGIHIAGELGGVGLIRNAIAQGRAAIDRIAADLARDPPAPGLIDVAIIGCGPAGLTAALGARAHGLNAVILDQATLGGSVAHYPRGKLVTTAPVEMPLLGTVQLGTISKEGLIAFWQQVIADHGLAPRFAERVDTIARDGEALVVRSDRGEIRAARVILATGRGGTPRRLDVPGEELAKVVYRLSDPLQYAGQAVAVIGGGDSALEAALALSEVGGTTVTLVHRGESFARARGATRARIEQLAREGAITVRRGARPGQIRPDHLVVVDAGGETALPNDAVIVCAGGTLPGEWLARIGIAVDWHHGDPLPG